MSFLSSCTSTDFLILLINYYLCKAVSCFEYYTRIQTNAYVYKHMYIKIYTISEPKENSHSKQIIIKIKDQCPFHVELFFLFKTLAIKKLVSFFSVQVFSVSPISIWPFSSIQSWLSTSSALLLQILASYFRSMTMTSYKSVSKYLQLIHRILKISLCRLMTSISVF